MPDSGPEFRRRVFSTDRSHERACPRCGNNPCTCPADTSDPAHRQAPRVRRETKGRGGKTVTVIADLNLNENDLRELARALKQLCGTGGTVKEGRIEIQGDHRDKVVAKLNDLGYRARAAGG